MKKAFLFLVFVALAQLVQAAVGFRNETFVDASRNNRSIALTVYYPSSTGGQDAAVGENAASKYPIIVIGHGFTMTAANYKVFADTLVPLGYIVAVANTETSFAPSHSNFGLDLKFIKDFLQAQNMVAASPYFSKISQNSAVLGHSMGGGCSFLAAQGNSGFTTICNFAPAETNPSATAAAALVGIPLLMFSGTNDCVVPPANSKPMYDAVPANVCKYRIVINNGTHCNFSTGASFCTLGEANCAATIPALQQLTTVFSLLKPWCAFHLKGESAAWNVFQTAAAAQNGFAEQHVCSITSTEENSAFADLKVTPNPTSGLFSVNLSMSQSPKNITLDVFNSQGIFIFSKKIDSQSTELDLGNQANGIYFLKFFDDKKLFYTNKILLIK